MVQQMAIHKQNCELIVSIPLSCPNNRNNFLQDAGQNIFCYKQQATDTSLEKVTHPFLTDFPLRRRPSIDMETEMAASRGLAELFSIRSRVGWTIAISPSIG